MAFWFCPGERHPNWFGKRILPAKKDNPDFAGIRTFSLIALLGSASSFLADDFGIILAALGLGGLILLITVSYSGTLLRNEIETGITTEVAAILTFLFGVLVMGDHAMIAIALAGNHFTAIDIPKAGCMGLSET